MALRAEQEGSALRLKGLEKQCRAARQEKEDLQKVAGDCRRGGGVGPSACPIAPCSRKGHLVTTVCGRPLANAWVFPKLLYQFDSPAGRVAEFTGFI